MGATEDIKIEEWRDIDGYIGLYQVSNFGRIKSLARQMAGNGIGFLSEKIRKPEKNRHGYLKCTLRGVNQKRKCLSIHRLVAEAFIENPNNLPQVNHRDEDKANNFYKNLEWATNRANANYSKNKNSTSKYPGVSWAKRECKWHVRCTFNGTYKSLGYYDDEELAASAYVDFCKQNNLNYSV